MSDVRAKNSKTRHSSGIKKEEGSDEDDDGEGSDEGEVCLTCGLSSNAEKLLECSNCARGGNGMGIFHYDCLKPPLAARPPEGEEVSRPTYAQLQDVCIIYMDPLHASCLSREIS